MDDAHLCRQSQDATVMQSALNIVNCYEGLRGKVTSYVYRLYIHSPVVLWLQGRREKKRRQMLHPEKDQSPNHEHTAVIILGTIT